MHGPRAVRHCGQVGWGLGAGTRAGTVGRRSLPWLSAQCADEAACTVRRIHSHRCLPLAARRFNQKHTPEHRMRLVRPRVTAMHMLQASAPPPPLPIHRQPRCCFLHTGSRSASRPTLTCAAGVPPACHMQAANPELPMDQLMWLLELTLTGGDEEEQRAPPPQQQQQGDRHVPPQQQQQGPPAPAGGGGSSGSGGSGAAVDGAAEELEFPALRRGPRPAYDAAAQEPSPSAHARPQPAPGQGAAAAASQGPGERGLIGGSDSGEEQEVHVPLESVLGGEQGAPSR